jgi:DNA-binding transcriptional LysR family regulator
MRVTIAQLEAFYWIAKLGSFQKAAHHLHIAQPTISLRIRDLERALGMSLFARQGRKVALTQEGRTMVEHAEVVLARMRHMTVHDDPETVVSGAVRIGVPETFAIMCVPSLLRSLARDFPDLRADLDVGTSAALIEDLLAESIDIAFVADPLEDKRLRLVPLGQHHMVWAAAPELGLRGTVSANSLDGIPVLSNPSPAPQYRIIMDWFRKGGASPSRLMTCNSVSVIVHLVCSGVGASILPVSMIRKELESGQLVEVAAQPPLPPSIIYACSLADAEQSKMRAVTGVTREVLREIRFLEPV